MPYKVDTADSEVARIAARQHGVVSAKQLAEAGLGRMAVSERSRNGRLHRIHRGVYAVGHRGLSLHGRFMAAVLACGEEAVLSHTSAVVLWGLLKPIAGPVHVSTPRITGRSRRPGIHLHRSPSLAGATRTSSSLHEPSPSPSYPASRGGRRGRLSPRATTYRHNIPVTTVNRTLQDLRATNLLPPHRGSVAFEDDHARDLALRSQGYTVLRYTDEQLENEPQRVVADVARALGVSGTPRG